MPHHSDDVAPCGHDWTDHDYSSKKRDEPFFLNTQRFDYYEWTECLRCNYTECVICGEECTCGLFSLKVFAGDEPDCTNATRRAAQ